MLDPEANLEQAQLDLLNHSVPVEGEWYTAMQSFWTRDFGIAGMDLKVVSVDVRLSDLTGQALVESIVEDAAGMRYQLPHAGTQALYKRRA